MNILHRFNLLVKGRINAVLDALEDPERSLLQLVQDMEEELDAAKRAVARAMANEDRLRAQIAFHAQDDHGNVWNLGEYPEEYEAGKFKGAPSTWLTGFQRAEAGIIMPADPTRTEPPSYLQGFAPAVDFIDEAQTSRTAQATCVPAKCYDDVLVVDEWIPGNPSDGHQLKFYAPGVGNVRVDFKGGDEEESLVLTSARMLTPAELATVRTEAMALDHHGYEVNKDYAQTAPAQASPGAPPGA